MKTFWGADVFNFLFAETDKFEENYSSHKR
jgi:hypothetical protein